MMLKVSMQIFFHRLTVNFTAYQNVVKAWTICYIPSFLEWISQKLGAHYKAQKAATTKAGQKMH
jgi:hypothetical protein